MSQMPNLSSTTEATSVARATDYVFVAVGGDSANIQKAKLSVVGTAILDAALATVADVAALTSAVITGGESPTEAEHNALRADVVAIRTTLNSLLDALQAAGLVDAT